MRQINIRFRIMCVFVILLGLTACNDFLDEAPSKTSSLVPSSAEQLDALLGNYLNFYEVSNNTTLYGTDDDGLNVTLYDEDSYNFVNMERFFYVLWDIDNLPATTHSLWTNEYKKIFIANMVLHSLGDVSGTAAEKAELQAESYLIRAYSLHELVNVYCLPYTESTGAEFGLPLKRSVSFEEASSRGTLKETHEQIESDLQEALKITTRLNQNGRMRIWRGSVEAVNAFAARYYLGRNNYTEALKYANLALEQHSSLVDYNTEMYYGRSENATIDDPENPGTPKTVTVQYPYTYNNQDVSDMILWKEFYYMRVLEEGNWWLVPSEGLLNLYDRDTMDLRYRYHIIEDFSLMKNMTYSYPGYVFFSRSWTPSGPTVAEMILTKAECQARAGDYREAMETVNLLRVRRMDNSLPEDRIKLSASSSEEALRKILEERRREMPFTTRWFDIRRLNTNDDPADDIVLEKVFYPYSTTGILSSEEPITYTLPKNSRRYAIPLPQSDINNSDGMILQNTY